MMVRWVLVFGAVMVLWCRTPEAQQKKPPLPAGRDPGGTAVALFCAGVDYTRPDLQVGLARDGEGELVGWDFKDNDNRPFDIRKGQTPPDWGGDGSALGVLLVKGKPAVRLVPIRIDPGDPLSLARAVAFVARTPARIATLPMGTASKEYWEPFRQAASRFTEILFVVAAGDEAKDLDKAPNYPAAFGLPNVLVVTAASDTPQAPLLPTANWGFTTVDAVAPARSSPFAAAVAAKLAAEMISRQPALRGAELKQRLLQLAIRQRTGETPIRTKSLAVLSPNPD